MKNNKKQRVLALLLGLSSMAQLPGNASAHKEKQQVTESSVSDGVLNGYKGLTNRLGAVTDSLKSNPESLAYLKLLGLLAVPALAGTALYKFTHRPTSLGPSLAYDSEKNIISDFMKNEAARKAEEEKNKKDKSISEFFKREADREKVRSKAKEKFDEYTESIGEIFENSLEIDEEYSTCSRFFFKNEHGDWYCWKIDMANSTRPVSIDDNGKALKYLRNNVLKFMRIDSDRPPENLPSADGSSSSGGDFVFHLNLVKDGYLIIGQSEEVAPVDTSTNEKEFNRINNSGIECFFVFPRSYIKGKGKGKVKVDFSALLFGGSELKSSADFPFIINVNNKLRIGHGKVSLKFAKNAFSDFYNDIKIPVAEDIDLNTSKLSFKSKK